CDRQYNQKNRKQTCSIHGGSPHFESYAFDGQNFDFCAWLECRAILPGAFRAPLFRADLDESALARRDPLAEDSPTSNHSVNIRRLNFYLQFGFEPSAEQREIQKRKHCCRKQTDVCGTEDKSHGAASNQRSPNQCKIESGKNAERQLRDNANNS